MTIETDGGHDGGGNFPAQTSARGWLVAFAGLAAVYAAAAARTVQPGDGGEFATVMLRGGMPHPPGYPLMRALGPLARGLEVLSLPPALAAALPCAVAGALGFALLGRRLARAGHGLAGWLAVGLAALSPPALGHVPDAEVWGLSVLLFAVVVSDALAPEPPRPFRRGLALGLAGAHHQTAVFLVPLAAGGLERHLRGAPLRTRAGAYGRALAGALAGLAAYLTLLFGRGGAFRWGGAMDLHRLVAHVLRRDFGTFQLGLSGLDVPAARLWGRALGSVAGAFTGGLAPWPLAGAAIAGAAVWAVVRPRPPLAPKVTAAGWLLALAGALVVFPALGNLDPRSPFAAWILERFDLLPLVLLVPFVSAALHGVAHRLARRSSAPMRRLAPGLVGLALAVVALRGFAHGVPATERVTEAYARAALASAEAGARPAPRPGLPGAVLVGLDDHRTFPILYAQAVLGDAPTVAYLDARLLAHPWYRVALRARFPGLPDADRPVRFVAALDRATGGAVPVFVTHRLSVPVARDLVLVPHGTVYRVAGFSGRGDRPPPLPRRASDHLAAMARARARLARADARPLLPIESPAPGHPFAGDLLLSALDPTRGMAEALTAAGDEVAAAKVRAAFAGASDRSP